MRDPQALLSRDIREALGVVLGHVSLKAEDDVRHRLHDPVVFAVALEAPTPPRISANLGGEQETSDQKGDHGAACCFVFVLYRYTWRKRVGNARRPDFEGGRGSNPLHELGIPAEHTVQMAFRQTPTC